jgi:hypothetical protein
LVYEIWNVIRQREAQKNKFKYEDKYSVDKDYFRQNTFRFDACSVHVKNKKHHNQANYSEENVKD